MRDTVVYQMFRMFVRWFKEWIGFYPPSSVDKQIHRSMQSKIDPNAFQDFVSEMNVMFKENHQKSRVNMTASHKPRFISSNGVVTDNQTGQIV